MPVRRPAEERARLGDEIYERDIRPHFEESHVGKTVAIDVDSGTFAIGDNAIDSSERVRAQCPDADIWLMRVGYKTFRSFGGGSRRRPE